MGRKILAVVAGFIVAFLVVAIFEYVGHLLFPLPAEIDPTDIEQIKAFAMKLPVGALLAVVVAWFAGAFVGGLLAAVIAKEKPLLFAAIVAAFILASSIFNLVMIPHPSWVMIAAIIGTPLMAFFAAKAAEMQKPAPVNT